MHGVVSLLDRRHYEIVENLWEELDRKFGVRGIRATPFPHFSYQIAAGYELELAEQRLRRLAAGLGRFTVDTSGLGLFSGPKPVLFVSVVRSPELEVIHRRVWESLHDAAHGVSGYYEAEHWVPHITLVHHDLTNQNVGEIVSYLSERSFTWEIEVDHVAIIYDGGDRQEIKFKCGFR